ncbi:GNAT family N-acetyltransferase [Mesorhizobium sp. NBSH29]|uniref:GNAT family N-acetyltransferase n=1 Tax=Mesorhizobium sp. NBSH29 TaxID=2654249 RepID=UPI0018968D4B|nr:GNAT family protein [Mesorhizobium sp. NBSH29]QPC87031.1 GNAT family N-acetyltransferase [Mesorhizobium sp. NBSH29]
MFALPFFRRDLPSLRGDRITLRLPEPSDYRAWSTLRLASRAFLEPWEPRWLPDELDSPAWRQRLRRTREDFEQGLSAAFLIFETRSGKLLGGITVGNIRHGVAQSCQIGYWIGERYSGQGYMQEAVRLATRFCFGQLMLHRIEAACIPDNARSIHVLEKAGFQREGLLRSYLRINGSWQDHYLYALIADEPGSKARG